MVQRKKMAFGMKEEIIRNMLFTLMGTPAFPLMGFLFSTRRPGFALFLILMQNDGSNFKIR